MNVRVPLIAVGTMGLAVGLALAEPAQPPTGKPFPAAVFELAAQAASRLPASQLSAAQAVPAAARKVPHSPTSYPLLWEAGAARSRAIP